MPHSLSRTTRGALALLVAAVLLLAGYGSYAYWSSSVNLNAGSINSGQLALTGTGAGQWANLTSGTAVAIPNITNFLVVPGDRLTYTVTRTVRAQGNDLRATLVADPTSITGDAAILAQTTVGTALTIGGNTVTTITPANDGQDVTAVVTIAFPFLPATNASQLQTINLSNLQLTLTQTQP